VGWRLEEWCGWELDREVPAGAEALIIQITLRGAEAPLFHVTAGSRHQIQRQRAEAPAPRAQGQEQRARAPALRELEPVDECDQAVEAEQGECGASPDHQRAFPAERAGDLALAAPGDQESRIVLSFH